MHSFFQFMTPWVRDEGSLHVYAVPDDPALQVIRAATLRKLIDGESSLMGKAFLAVYEREAEGRSKA